MARLSLLGGSLLVAAVLPWGWLALEPHAPYRNIFHMMASVQGAGMALLAAALVHWVPIRRSVLALLVALPVLTTITAWFRHALPNEIMLGVSELSWLANAVLIAWLVWRHKGRLLADPASRIWALFGVSGSIVGAVLLSTYSMLLLRDVQLPWLVVVGRGLLLEGLPLTALVVAAPWLAARLGASRKPAGVQRGLLEVGAFAGAQFLEAFAWPAVGFLICGLTMVAVLERAGLRLRLGNRPAQEGWSVVASGMWLVVVGYLLAALAPQMRLIGLHVVFLAGFALVALAGLMVAARPARITRTDIYMPLMAALAAAVLRAWYEVEMSRPWPLGGAVCMVVAMAWVATRRPAAR